MTYYVDEHGEFAAVVAAELRSVDPVAPVHHGRVWRDGAGFWVARCDGCGWRGVKWSSRRAAEVLLERHLEEAA